EEHAQSPVSPHRGARVRERRAQPDAGGARRHPASPMNARGFTLIEMLVAIGLMALMALLCWRGLVYVADQRGTVEREATDLSQLMRAFAQIERDLAERVPDAALPVPGASTELPLAIEVHPLER